MTGSVVVVGVLVVVVGVLVVAVVVVGIVVVALVVVVIAAVALVVEVGDDGAAVLDVTRSVVVGLVPADDPPGKAGPDGLPPAELLGLDGTYPIIMPTIPDITIATTIDHVGHRRFSRIGSTLDAPSLSSSRPATGNRTAHKSAGSKKPSTLKSRSSPAAHMGANTSQREVPANNLTIRP
jgi:hypothetical protein